LSFVRGYAKEPQFHYADIFAPAEPKTTPYRKLTSDHVSTFEVNGEIVLKVFWLAWASAATDPLPRV
jgi:hypothetical protein